MINLRFIGHLLALIVFIFLGSYAVQFAGVTYCPWWVFPAVFSSVLCGALSVISFVSGLDLK